MRHIASILGVKMNTKISRDKVYDENKNEADNNPLRDFCERHGLAIVSWAWFVAGWVCCGIMYGHYFR